MSFDLREEARRRERERRALAEERESFFRDLRAVAARAEGKRLFRWLLRQGEIFRDDYLPGADGAYSAGRRSLALRLWRLLEEALGRDAFLDVAAAVLLENRSADPPTESGDRTEASPIGRDESYM